MDLVVVVLAEFLHGFFDIVVFRLFEVFVNLLFFIGINHFLDEIIDVDLGSGEDDCLQLVQHLLHGHAVALREVVQIDPAVDGLDDLFLTRRFLGYGTYAQVLGTYDFVLIDVFFDDPKELVAVSFCFRNADARNGQQLLHRNRIGCSHGLEARVLEDDKRRYVVLFRYFPSYIFEDGEEYFIRRGACGSGAFHDLVFLVLNLDRYFEFARFSQEFYTIFGQFEVAV